MRYLCPHHLKNIAADPVLAMTLWNGAMENGNQASIKQDWNAARSFFGAAYETAILHNRQSQVGNLFSVSHLVESSQKLSDVLQQLNLWEESHMCLLTIQNGLLLESVKPKHGIIGPDGILDKTQEVVDEMIELLDCSQINASNQGKNDLHQTENSSEKMSRQTTSKQSKENQNLKTPSLKTVSAEAKQSETITTDMEVLLSSTFYLMTRYAIKPTRQLSKFITEHLERLFRHADCSSPALNKTCRRLYLQWQDIQPKTSIKKFKPLIENSFPDKAVH